MFNISFPKRREGGRREGYSFGTTVEQQAEQGFLARLDGPQAVVEDALTRMKSEDIDRELVSSGIKNISGTFRVSLKRDLHTTPHLMLSFQNVSEGGLKDFLIERLSEERGFPEGLVTVEDASLMISGTYPDGSNWAGMDRHTAMLTQNQQEHFDRMQ